MILVDGPNAKKMKNNLDFFNIKMLIWLWYNKNIVITA